jgi:hypothetical protein
VSGARLDVAFTRSWAARGFLWSWAALCTVVGAVLFVEIPSWWALSAFAFFAGAAALGWTALSAPRRDAELESLIADIAAAKPATESHSHSPLVTDSRKS